MSDTGGYQSYTQEKGSTAPYTDLGHVNTQYQNNPPDDVDSYGYMTPQPSSDQNQQPSATNSAPGGHNQQPSATGSAHDGQNQQPSATNSAPSGQNDPVYLQLTDDEYQHIPDVHFNPKKGQNSRGKLPEVPRETPVKQMSRVSTHAQKTTTHAQGKSHRKCYIAVGVVVTLIVVAVIIGLVVHFVTLSSSSNNNNGGKTDNKNGGTVGGGDGTTAPPPPSTNAPPPSTATTPAQSSCTVTYEVHKDKKMPQSDMDSSTTVASCRSSCEASSQCIGINFDNNNSKCRLVRSRGQLEAQTHTDYHNLLYSCSGYSYEPHPDKKVSQGSVLQEGVTGRDNCLARCNSQVNCRSADVKPDYRCYLYLGDTDPGTTNSQGTTHFRRQ